MYLYITWTKGVPDISTGDRVAKQRGTEYIEAEAEPLIPHTPDAISYTMLQGCPDETMCLCVSKVISLHSESISDVILMTAMCIMVGLDHEGMNSAFANMPRPLGSENCYSPLYFEETWG